jgi:hypothetical protein
MNARNSCGSYALNWLSEATSTSMKMNFRHASLMSQYSDTRNKYSIMWCEAVPPTWLECNGRCMSLEHCHAKWSHDARSGLQVYKETVRKLYKAWISPCKDASGQTVVRSRVYQVKQTTTTDGHQQVFQRKDPRDGFLYVIVDPASSSCRGVLHRGQVN